MSYEAGGIPVVSLCLGSLQLLAGLWLLLKVIDNRKKAKLVLSPSRSVLVFNISSFCDALQDKGEQVVRFPNEFMYFTSVVCSIFLIAVIVRFRHSYHIMSLSSSFQCSRFCNREDHFVCRIWFAMWSFLRGYSRFSRI